MRNLSADELNSVSGGRGFLLNGLSNIFADAQNAVQHAETDVSNAGAKVQTALSGNAGLASIANTIFKDASGVLSAVDKGLGDLSSIAANTKVTVTTTA
ncbi:hypothetical protein LWC05_01435 [Acetobacter sicerae]|uniref:Uncharacterized protein n=1 Tax=Acetobacter sicerae TaxID=85325 RepID=A0ABS8VQA9_9PROT|nr:hypothetical protein [Acetobacter sicerae]MCE0742560.1 hypothetical protein [Acetobacter sicerae]